MSKLLVKIVFLKKRKVMAPKSNNIKKCIVRLADAH